MALSKPGTSSDFDTGGAKRQVLRSQARGIIFRVYNFFKKCSNEEEREKIDFKKCQLLTSKACGVNKSTVSQICSEAKKSDISSAPVFLSPRKHRGPPKRHTNLNDFEKDVLRRTIFDMYDHGEFPTIKKLTLALKSKISYQGSDSSTYRILRNLGFKYRKSNDGRQFLMERGDIVAARIKFLRTMHRIRTSGDTRPIFYLDETWVNQNHSLKYIWQDTGKNGGLKVPVGKGSRLIVCHVGSAKTGFIPDSKWVFRSRKTSDYHDEMTASTFKEWFVNRFLNYLDEGSIIIMDNAPYHSVSINKIPNTSSRKRDIIEWLQQKGIEFSTAETIPELLQRVLPFKNQTKMYELDVLANEMDHEVIRLPPYDCQYNPIELLWAQIKKGVANRNKTFKLKDVEKLMNEEIDKVTQANWENCVRHAEKLQEEDFMKEVQRDEILEPIIINLQDSDDSDEQPTDEDEDEDEDNPGEGDDDDENILAVPLD